MPQRLAVMTHYERNRVRSIASRMRALADGVSGAKRLTRRQRISLLSDAAMLFECLGRHKRAGRVRSRVLDLKREWGLL